MQGIRTDKQYCYGQLGTGREALVGLLLTREDIDVNAKGKHGQTPLLLAAGKGHEAVVELLRNDKRTIQ